MAFRFRKNFGSRGSRLTLGKRSLSAGSGGRWAGLSLGPGGARARASLPGSGLSWSKRLSSSSRRGGNPILGALVFFFLVAVAIRWVFG